jgi:hypothetical protein
MRKLIFLLAVLSLSVLTSCDKEDCIRGEGSVISETLYAPDFEGIRVNGSLDVFIEHGETQEVIAIGHPNIIDRVRLDEIGDILIIELESDCYRDYELAIYITTPNLERVELDGSGMVDIGPMENETDLSLELNGSGDIQFQSFTGVSNLIVEIDGSGTVRGFDDFPDLVNLDIDIEGSGDYRGFDVITENCIVDISGSGDCRVHVLENLDVTINGSGDVFYRGFPNISSTINGSGDIINAN